MAYLAVTDYENYGLDAATSLDWVTAATALINGYCRRPDLNVVEYVERLRVTAGAQTVMLSYLPLAPLAPATSPLVAIEGRYARPRRGEPAWQGLMDVALAFSLPGEWVTIDPTLADVDPRNGELTLPYSLFGLPYNEIKVTYTAGLATIGDDVKSACAQIVCNAQAMPALNVSHSKMDTMQMQYFSSSLIDDTVAMLLRPYVANRLG